MTGLPKRKATRLKGYDYPAPGAYFVTICTNQKLHLLGAIDNGIMRLNDLGKIVNQEILKIETQYHIVKIDKYVIMPNHVHMLIVILETEGMNSFSTIQYDIPNIILVSLKRE